VIDEYLLDSHPDLSQVPFLARKAALEPFANVLKRSPMGTTDGAVGFGPGNIIDAGSRRVRYWRTLDRSMVFGGSRRSAIC
jgi:hypothetical protein